MRRGENIYRRRDGRWEGRYKKGRKSDGCVKYGYVYGKTLHEVRNKLYPLKVHYQTIQEMQGSSCVAFEEWATLWLKEIQESVKPATYANYYYKMTKYVFPFIGDVFLNELTPEIGGKLLLKWTRYGLKHSTKQVIFRIVCQCLKYAKEQKQLKDNPFLSVKLPKENKVKIRALTKNEQQRLENTALKEKHNQGIPAYLALYTGLRIGEIAALCWSDIDFENNLLQVNHTYQRIALPLGNQRTQLVFDTAKTEASTRVVPLGNKLKRLLSKLKKSSTSQYVFSYKNKPLEPRLLTYHFQQLRKKCKLERIHFHQLRHTFATRCLEIQGDILSVSAMLGHTSTQLTLDTYADSMIEQRVKIIYQMEKAIS